MQNSDEIMNWYQTFTPTQEERKSWYAPVAKIYDRLRPKYSRAFLERVIEVGEIPAAGKILEIGCGPGTATTTLAEMGFSILGLEPSLETCKIARQNTIAYSQVEIINTNFEEWIGTDRSFDAVVAATSWHWIAPEHKHEKVSSLLHDRGSLILLWNTGMQPPFQIFQHLIETLAEYLPSLAKYKERSTELNEVRLFANAAIDSGLFSKLIQEYRLMEIDYSIDDYLQLLTTYSPWIALSSARRQELLAKLRDILYQHCDDRIPLSYQSIFHIARK
jgi:SAM-dependent methyltransferase